MFCLVARIAFTVCTRSLTACNSAINVVQRAFISMLLMERKSSVIRLWAQCAHKHAYMKQSNEKGWRWLSVQNERNKKKWNATAHHDEVTQFSFAYNSIYSVKPSRYFCYSERNKMKRKKTTNSSYNRMDKLLFECQFTVYANFYQLQEIFYSISLFSDWFR